MLGVKARRGRVLEAIGAEVERHCRNCGELGELDSDGYCDCVNDTDRRGPVRILDCTGCGHLPWNCTCDTGPTFDFGNGDIRPLEQECRDCGEMFPRDDDADRCLDCVAEMISAEAS